MTDVAVAEAPAPELLHGCPVTYSRGQKTVHVPKAGYLKLVGALKADGYNMLIDLVAVDYLATDDRDLGDTVGERYEVVANLLSHSLAARIRVRVQLEADSPNVASLYDLYQGAEAMEREAYDLVGIIFDGHPDLSRILLPDGWEGHPLRKDYATGRIPVQFKAAPQPR
jgi:NADH-quinone oxidoreductase subunit C